MTEHEAVGLAGRQAAIDPYFLAFALAEYAAREGLADPALAAALGATPDALAAARLCPAPRADPAGFRADVDRIAARLGLARDALAEVARHGQVVAALRADGDRPAGSAAPFLAARDKTP